MDACMHACMRACCGLLALALPVRGPPRKPALVRSSKMGRSLSRPTSCWYADGNGSVALALRTHTGRSPCAAMQNATTRLLAQKNSSHGRTVICPAPRLGELVCTHLRGAPTFQSNQLLSNAAAQQQQHLQTSYVRMHAPPRLRPWTQDWRWLAHRDRT